MRRYRTPFDDTMSWITGGDDTGGAYSLHERIAPPGARSTPHIHSRLTEAFYVLEGAFEFEIDGERIGGAPGVFIQASPGVTHAWRVVGEAAARAIVMFRPSAEEAYFAELDAMVSAGPIDPAALRRLSDRYGWT
jgi:quercetin dioxygenase-like cupin family protein